MKTEAKLNLRKINNQTNGPVYQVRCAYFLNGEETFEQVLVPSVSETEGSYIIELLEKGKTLGEIHDMLHGVTTVD